MGRKKRNFSCLFLLPRALHPRLLLLLFPLFLCLGIIFSSHPAQARPEASVSAPLLHNYGPAPKLVGLEAWFNSPPLTLDTLQGKVVLVDFWTYSCINCLRTLPHLSRWHEKYHALGLVIIGIHTPEFPYEKSKANLERAIKRFKIPYAVAQDNQYATWHAYNNEYWPASYLIDRQGNIRRQHFGEGGYTEMAQSIESLLKQ